MMIRLGGITTHTIRLEWLLVVECCKILPYYSDGVVSFRVQLWVHTVCSVCNAEHRFCAGKSIHSATAGGRHLLHLHSSPGEEKMSVQSWCKGSRISKRLHWKYTSFGPATRLPSYWGSNARLQPLVESYSHTTE